MEEDHIRALQTTKLNPNGPKIVLVTVSAAGIILPTTRITGQHLVRHHLLSDNFFKQQNIEGTLNKILRLQNRAQENCALVSTVKHLRLY